jgi:thiol:disulfide interchange protein
VRFAVIALVLACSTSDSAPAKLTWAKDEATAFQRARRENKGVMIEFFASWAIQSIHVDRMLDARASEIEKRFVPLKVDITHETDALVKIQERYQSQSAPVVIFVSTTGKELGRFNWVPADEQELSTLIAKAVARL